MSITDRISLGPLTTSFSAPSSCFTPYVTGSDGQYNAFPAETCAGSLPVTLQDPACFPTQMSGYVFSDLPDLGTMGYMSPAPSCPVGFSQACTISRTSGDHAPAVTASATANSAIYALLSAGETVVGCCMTGYGCDQTNPNYCTSSATDGQVISGSSFDQKCKPTPASITIQGSQSTPVGTHMRVHLLTAASKTTLSTSTSSTTATASISLPALAATSIASTATAQLASSQNGLSTGAKAAIGVVVGVVGLALLSALIFFLFVKPKRRARAADAGSSSSSTSPSSLGGKPELDGTSAHPAAVRPELDSSVFEKTAPQDSGGLAELQGPGVTAAELGGHEGIAELPGSEVAVELPKKAL